MNFLQIVQRVHRKCRVSGTTPASTAGTQSAEVARLIDWTNEAWMDIQNSERDWKWMRKSVSFQTEQGKAEYTIDQTGAQNLGNWFLDTFRVYRTADGLIGENRLFARDYEWWREVHQFGSARNSVTIPVHVAELPNHGIGLGPAPLGGLTVTGDYYQRATELAGNDAVPGMPSQFHMAIVYRAMMFYGMSESAQEVFNEGESEFARILGALELRELPDICAGGAME